MGKIYIVTYERYDTFEIKEVFRSRESALKYLEGYAVSVMVQDGYKLDCFYIIEKFLWEE